MTGPSGFDPTVGTSTVTSGATAAEPVTSSSPGDGRSLGEIVGDLTHDMTTLVKQELELAKTELKEEAGKAGKGAGLLGGAGVSGLLALIFLSGALAYLLDSWIPRELAFLIVGLLVGRHRGGPGEERTEVTQADEPAAAGDAADTQGGRGMGQSTEELSNEIEETRRSMTTNVDALQDRVSPSAIVERRKAAARGRVQSVRDRVMGTAQSVRGSATDTVGSTKDSAHGAVGSVKDTAHGTVSGAQDKVEGSPMAAGLVAFGAGLVIASLIPASDKEARAAGQVVDTVKDKGQPLVEDVKSAAQDLAQDVAASASDAASTVKDTATQSAERVRDEGKSGVDEVRSETGH